MYNFWLKVDYAYEEVEIVNLPSIWMCSVQVMIKQTGTSVLLVRMVICRWESLWCISTVFERFFTGFSLCIGFVQLKDRPMLEFWSVFLFHGYLYNFIWKSALSFHDSFLFMLRFQSWNCQWWMFAIPWFGILILETSSQAEAPVLFFFCYFSFFTLPFIFCFRSNKWRFFSQRNTGLPMTIIYCTYYQKLGDDN